MNDQVKVAGVNWALDTSVGFLGLSSFGPDGLPSVNGIVGSLPFIWWTERDNPGIQLITEQADLNERDAVTRNIAYLGGWMWIDSFIEFNVQTANRVGSADFSGADLKETIEGMDYNALGLLRYYWREGSRDLDSNRMAVLTYAGADGGTVLDGQAPLMVDRGDGTMIPIPVVVPLEDFRDTPDLRPVAQTFQICNLRNCINTGAADLGCPFL